MNKELFVSSTPHETKVGLVEDDLLAEIYLERENEYTLAGSIYKGRVTRVLPGMQSAFVDIGLERDAFLYVSDFMELEEHDEDLTDVVPANRGVQDLRTPAAAEPAPPVVNEAAEPEASFGDNGSQDFVETEEPAEEAQPTIAATPDASTGGASQDRERGGWRGRRRRRGGRRDGRGDGRDRGPEPRFARPAEGAPAAAYTPAAARPQESGRSQFGPPVGYQPILLPGESISKYRGLASTAVVQECRPQDAGTEASLASAPAAEPAAPLAATFPDDEPIFAAASASASAAAAPPVETTHEQHDNSRHAQDHHTEAAPTGSASTSVEWNREFRRQEPANTAVEAPAEEFVEEEEEMVTPQSEP